MSKTGAGLAKWASDIYNAKTHVYWYGTYCNPCTASRLAGKTKQYPSHYTAKRRATYEKHIAQGKTCTDCVGLIKGYLWEEGGEISYKRNDIPDRSASGMYSASPVKGPISTMPEIPGLLVWTANKGHVGVYVGGGRVVEARGFAYGVQKNKVSSRGFKFWGLCPYAGHTAEVMAKAKAAVNGTKTPAAAPAEKVEQKPDQQTGGAETGKMEGKTVVIELTTLREKSQGGQVRTLQRLLNALGHDSGEVDGIFGSKTENAVRAFQKAKGLGVDGIVGANTWAALLK